MPTEFEERDGKPVAVTSKFGPGLEPRSAVTAWDPPRLFAAQGESWGGSPPIAMEWSVEARAGGVCLVRVVGTGKRFFAEGTPAPAFELVSTTATPTGVLLNTYKVVGPLRAG